MCIPRDSALLVEGEQHTWCVFPLVRAIPGKEVSHCEVGKFLTTDGNAWSAVRKSVSTFNFEGTHRRRVERQLCEVDNFVCF